MKAKCVLFSARTHWLALHANIGCQNKQFCGCDCASCVVTCVCSVMMESWCTIIVSKYASSAAKASFVLLSAFVASTASSKCCFATVTTENFVLVSSTRLERAASGLNASANFAAAEAYAEDQATTRQPVVNRQQIKPQDARHLHHVRQRTGVPTGQITTIAA